MYNDGSKHNQREEEIQVLEELLEKVYKRGRDWEYLSTCASKGTSTFSTLAQRSMHTSVWV